MVSVTLRFHGPIDRRGLPPEHTLSLPQGSTIEQLLLHLGYPREQLRVIMTTRAGEKRPKQATLEPGEVLDIFVLASGG